MKISAQNYPTDFGTSYRKVIKPSYSLGDCYEASTYFMYTGLNGISNSRVQFIAPI